MTSWGVIGLGRIAEDFIQGLEESPRGTLHAVASVSKSALDKFKVTHPNVATYDNYDELLTDVNLDAIYIALSSDLHSKYTSKALKKGIPVICRVPSVKTTAEFDHIIEWSTQYHTLYMEGLRTRFLPSYLQLMKDLITIGDIKEIHCNVDGSEEDDDTYNYPIGFALGLIESKLMNIEINDEEGLEKIYLTFRNGSKLIIERTNIPLKACKIIGTKGTIIIDDYSELNAYTMFVNNQSVDRNFDIENDLVYVIDAVDLCRDKGLIEHPNMTLQDTREIIEIVSRIRKEIMYG